MSPTAYLMVGIPGSGKSYAISTIFGQSDTSIISPDGVRAEISGSAADQSLNEAVWKLVESRVRQELSAQHDVVIDATNAKRSDRTMLVSWCRESGAGRVEAIWLRTRFAVCVGRNKSRERVVPLHALKRMEQWLIRNPPSVTEGFDIIHCIP